MAKKLVPLLAAMWLLLASILPGESLGADKVRFTMNWVVYGQHAGFYAALDKGYYKKAGLEVEILRGFGSGDTVTRVGSKATEFGYADVGSLVVGRSKGMQVKALGMILAKSVNVIYCVKEAGVKTPKDLAGKKIAAAVGEGPYLVLPGFLAANGVRMDQVNMVFMAPNAKFPSMLAGKADCSVEYTVAYPQYKAAADKAGKEFNGLAYGDWGLDLYATSLLAPDSLVAGNPALVKRFVTATMEGVAWGVEHPEETVALFVKYHPNWNKQVAGDAWRLTVDHLLTDEAAKQGIGHISAEKMKKTLDTLVKYMKISPAPAPKDLYTNEFLPRLFPKRR